MDDMRYCLSMSEFCCKEVLFSLFRSVWIPIQTALALLLPCLLDSLRIALLLLRLRQSHSILRYIPKVLWQVFVLERYGERRHSSNKEILDLTAEQAVQQLRRCGHAQTSNGMVSAFLFNLHIINKHSVRYSFCQKY